MTPMKLEREALAAAVSTAAAGLPQRPSQPERLAMLVSVHSGFAHFRASDGDVVFESACPCEGTLETMVPGRLFTSIVKSLPGEEVTFELDGQLLVSSGRARFTVAVSEGTPPGVPGPAPVSGTCDGAALSAGFRRVAAAAARAHADPAYTAVEMEVSDGILTLAATDRYRVAVVTLDCEGEVRSRALVPAWAASGFAAEGEVSFGWDSGTATFTSASGSFTTRLLAGELPDWRRFLPRENPGIQAGSRELSDAVKRARLTLEDTDPVQLLFGDGVITVAGKGHSEEVDAPGSSGDIPLLVSPQWLMDGLAGTSEPKLEVSAPLAPLFICEGNYSYSLTPRRKV